MEKTCSSCLATMRENMQLSLNFLEKELDKIHAGKASTKMLDGIKVDYYGSMTPIEQIAAINAPDPRQITIQPWERNMIPVIEKAIMAANLGFNPQNNGEVIRVLIPALTEERRKELVKKVKQEVEQSKINIRNCRRNTISDAKEMKDNGVSEDEIKKLETDIQKVTDEMIQKTDKLSDLKEKEIMTI